MIIKLSVGISCERDTRIIFLGLEGNVAGNETCQQDLPTRLANETCSRDLQLLVGGAPHMTGSWHWRPRAFRARLGDDFDDDCAVDRRDWHVVGWSRDGRFGNRAGPELRQYPDPDRCDCDMHRHDDA